MRALILVAGTALATACSSQDHDATMTPDNAATVKVENGTITICDDKGCKAHVLKEGDHSGLPKK